MDNFIRIILLEKKKSIEANNRFSDNKFYHIKREKLELVNGLMASNRIKETEKLEALKIIGVKA
jgi:hypothetical protein